MKRNNFILMGLTLSFIATSLFFQNCAKMRFTDLSSAQASKAVIPQCREVDSPALAPDHVVSWDNLKADDIYKDYNQVMAAPVVGQLDLDIQSEIVFIAFKGSAYEAEGVLRVIDGITAATQFTIGGDDAPIGATTPVIADLNGDGKNEIVYIHKSNKKIIAISNDGTKRWEFALPYSMAVGFNSTISVSDLNKNGKTEIVFGNYIVEEDFEGKPQVLVQAGTFTHSWITNSYVAALDASHPNEMSIINSSQGKVFNSDGSLKYDILDGGGFRFVAVADFETGVPGMELIGLKGGNIIVVNGLTGKIIKSKPLGDGGGGALSIGDFDGDPVNAEIAIASAHYLSIFDHDLNLISRMETQDFSSSFTGITSFDFNGDKKAEVIYSDEKYLRIYELDKDKKLKVAQQLVNPTGTLAEYPIVADVTGDGSAELIVVSNNYAVESLYSHGGLDDIDRPIAKKITGIRIFSSALSNAWMPASATWNQYDFNASTLNADGSLKSTSDTTGALSQTFRINANLQNTDQGCIVVNEAADKVQMLGQ